MIIGSPTCLPAWLPDSSRTAHSPLAVYPALILVSFGSLFPSRVTEDDGPSQTSQRENREAMCAAGARCPSPADLSGQSCTGLASVRGSEQLPGSHTERLSAHFCTKLTHRAYSEG